MASSLAGKLGFMVWVVGGSSPQNSLVRTKRLHTNDSPPKKPLHSSTCCWDAWNTLKIAHEWSTHSSSQVLAHLCFLFWGEVIYNIEPLGPNAPISDVVEMIVWLWGQKKLLSWSQFVYNHSGIHVTLEATAVCESPQCSCPWSLRQPQKILQDHQSVWL